MKSFQQHLKESRKTQGVWGRQSPLQLIADPQYVFFPITKKWLEEKMKRRVRRVKAFHITNHKHLQQLLNNQGSKKSISVHTEIPLFREDYISGYQGGGGTFVVLEGDLLLESFSDAWTKIDPSGRRWTSLDVFAANLKNKMIGQGRDVADDHLKKYKKILRSDSERRIVVSDFFHQMKARFLKKKGILQGIVDRYIEFTEWQNSDDPRDRAKYSDAVNFIPRSKSNDNTRLRNFYMLMEEAAVEVFTGSYSEKTFFDALKRKSGRSFNLESYLELILSSYFYTFLSPSEQKNLVTEYINYWQKIIDKDPEIVRFLTDSYELLTIQRDDKSNEAVITNYKVESVLFGPHYGNFKDPKNPDDFTGVKWWAESEWASNIPPIYYDELAGDRYLSGESIDNDPKERFVDYVRAEFPSLRSGKIDYYLMDNIDEVQDHLKEVESIGDIVK